MLTSIAKKKLLSQDKIIVINHSSIKKNGVPALQRPRPIPAVCHSGGDEVQIGGGFVLNPIAAWAAAMVVFVLGTIFLPKIMKAR